MKITKVRIVERVYEKSPTKYVVQAKWNVWGWTKWVNTHDGEQDTIEEAEKVAEQTLPMKRPIEKILKLYPNT